LPRDGLLRLAMGLPLCQPIRIGGGGVFGRAASAGPVLPSGRGSKWGGNGRRVGGRRAEQPTRCASAHRGGLRSWRGRRAGRAPPRSGRGGTPRSRAAGAREARPAGQAAPPQGAQFRGAQAARPPRRAPSVATPAQAAGRRPRNRRAGCLGSWSCLSVFFRRAHGRARSCPWRGMRTRSYSSLFFTRCLCLFFRRAHGRARSCPWRGMRTSARRDKSRARSARQQRARRARGAVGLGSWDVCPPFFTGLFYSAAMDGRGTAQDGRCSSPQGCGRSRAGMRSCGASAPSPGAAQRPPARCPRAGLLSFSGCVRGGEHGGPGRRPPGGRGGPVRQAPRRAAGGARRAQRVAGRAMEGARREAPRRATCRPPGRGPPADGMEETRGKDRL
jgi:hypothetical protein